MKNLEQKRTALKEVKDSLANSYRKPISNIGYTFFVSYDGGCVLRDVVKGYREKYGIPVEILDYAVAYFAGSKEKALALQETFGGSAKSCE